MHKRRHNNITFLYGIALLAAISLTSLGFAVWHAGIMQTTDETSTNVEVDTISNQTLVVECIKGEGNTGNIYIDSGSNASDGENQIIGQDPNNTSNRKMDYPVIFDVIYTESYVQFNGLDISMKIDKNGNSNDANIATTSSLVVDPFDSTKDIFGRELNSSKTGYKADLTYLNTSFTTISSSNFVEGTAISGYKHIYFDATSGGNLFKFTFGSYFNNQDPETFYNAKLISYRNDYQKETDATVRNQKLNRYLTALETVKNELTLLNENVNGSTIKLTINANYSIIN